MYTVEPQYYISSVVSLIWGVNNWQEIRGCGGTGSDFDGMQFDPNQLSDESPTCAHRRRRKTAEATGGELWSLIHTKFWQPCGESGRKGEEGQKGWRDVMKEGWFKKMRGREGQSSYSFTTHFEALKKKKNFNLSLFHNLKKDENVKIIK